MVSTDHAVSDQRTRRRRISVNYDGTASAAGAAGGCSVAGAASFSWTP